MATESPVYTRLTRNTAELATYSSLWRASDHLLIVSSTGYNETYARIMFGDIKAFFITPTGRRLWWGVAWGLIAIVSGIRVLVLLRDPERPIVSGIFFGVSALAWILNWTRGGGCRVHVMTGVQNTVLPSLVRTKKTHAVLAQLQPLIVAAQAVGGPASAASAAAATAPAVVAGLPPAEPPVAPPPTSS